DARAFRATAKKRAPFWRPSPHNYLYLVSAAGKIVPALETTALSGAVFPGFGNGYADVPAIDGRPIQFLDGFAGRFVIRHFHKRKTAGFPREFVHNDLGGSYFAILCKIVTQVVIRDVEA